VESELGKGSTFYTEIPTVYIGERVSAQDVAGLPAPEFHRAPVLILEDNSETALLFETYLRHSEFQPIVTGDVGQAEAWVARHTPAAVLADIYLGEDLVWGFMTSVRDRFPTVPMIVTSAHDEAQLALAKGASTFLPKPVDRETLTRELRRLTSNTGTRRLLLVDDNEVSRYIVRELLDRPWLDITEAGNGSEAIRLIDEQTPDAVILDLLMPDLSGLQVLRRLRERASTGTLPVLIYTSKVLSENERTELESLGAKLVRKEDVSTRLSAQPFFDWLAGEGLSPEARVPEENV